MLAGVWIFQGNVAFTKPDDVPVATTVFTIEDIFRFCIW